MQDDDTVFRQLKFLRHQELVGSRHRK